MTAYLATSPGGLDTVAVIAAGSNADMALIMAMQTLRPFPFAAWALKRILLSGNGTGSH